MNYSTHESLSLACPMFQIFELLGKKWVLFILILIKRGDDSFNAILKKTPGLNPKILSDRLDLLTEKGWIKRHVTNNKPLKITYSLTDFGLALSGKLEELGTWIKETSLPDSSK